MGNRISVIMCTYNGEEYVPKCLKSILAQRYGDFEILCIDGGSTDGTLEIIRNLSRKDRRVKLVENPRRIPEGKGNGKWLGFKKAKGDIIAIIDQDNILQRKTVFSEASKALNSNPQVFGVLGGLTHDLKDPRIVRYVSIYGTDSFFAYRSVDFIRRMISRCKIMKFHKQHAWITGGNCFFYRKKDITNIGGYDRDVAVVKKMVDSGKDELFIVNDATKHYAETSLAKLLIKKFKWGRNYFNRSRVENKGSFSYLSTTTEKLLFAANFIFCISLIPYAIVGIYQSISNRDPVALLFPIHAFITAIAYLLSAL